MLPGKKYTPDDLVRVARRRAWMVIVPFAVISAGTALVARKLPDRYVSQATVLVIPQQVASDIVKPVAASPLDERLRDMNQELQSRTRLERIMDELNLYPEERKKWIMEDVIEQMRKDISVQTVGGDTFQVRYYSDRAVTAQKVAERLAEDFMEENVKNADSLAVNAPRKLVGREDIRQASSMNEWQCV